MSVGSRWRFDVVLFTSEDKNFPYHCTKRLRHYPCLQVVGEHLVQKSVPETTILSYRSSSKSLWPICAIWSCHCDGPCSVYHCLPLSSRISILLQSVYVFPINFGVKPFQKNTFLCRNPRLPWHDATPWWWLLWSIISVRDTHEPSTDRSNLYRNIRSPRWFCKTFVTVSERPMSPWCSQRRDIVVILMDGNHLDSFGRSQLYVHLVPSNQPVS